MLLEGAKNVFPRQTRPLVEDWKSKPNYHCYCLLVLSKIKHSRFIYFDLSLLVFHPWGGKWNKAWYRRRIENFVQTRLACSSTCNFLKTERSREVPEPKRDPIYWRCLTFMFNFRNMKASTNIFPLMPRRNNDVDLHDIQNKVLRKYAEIYVLCERRALNLVFKRTSYQSFSIIWAMRTNCAYFL